MASHAPPRAGGTKAVAKPRTQDNGGRWEYARIYGPAVLLGLLALVVAYQFVGPPPPDRITIATGSRQGAYFAFAERYREILARDGVTVEVRETQGSVENIALLESPDSGVDVAFVQGGTGSYATGDELVSLASLYYEPMWVFYRRGMPHERVIDLIGKRVSLGPEGSGTRALAIQLLADNNLREDEIEISDLNGESAREALHTGRLDFLFMVASPERPSVRQLLESEDVALASFVRAETYTRVHRFLSKLTFPAGVVDMRADLPPHDVKLLAATANLVSRQDLHPAIVDLLLDAATEVHRDGGIFEEYAEFPSSRHLVFPQNEDAQNYFESGTPFLRRHLPYWAATLINRTLVMIVPLLVVILPLMRIMPPLYRWRMRSRVYRWYKRLRVLEGQIREGVLSSGDVEGYLSELKRIDHDVKNVSIPWAYAEQLYHLRVHINYVRETLESREQGAKERAV